MEKEAIIRQKLRLEGQVKSGSNWFIWIAGLSIVNSLMYLFGGQLNFIIGLGITQIIDVIGKALSDKLGSSIILVFVLIADIIMSGIFFLFGKMCNKKKNWAFIIGMVLYSFDGLIFLLVKDMLSVAFHVFALYCIYKGFSAKKKLDILIQDVEINNDNTFDVNAAENIDIVN